MGKSRKDSPENRCGANLRKKPGKTCGLRPLVGKARCRLHGGSMSKGAGHPSFKHGRYSSVLPKNLLAKYLAAAKDPELLSHQDELRLLDAHLGELVEALKRHDQRNVTDEAMEAWGFFKKDYNIKWFQRLDELLGTPNTEVPPEWSEIRDVVDLRKRVLESETKRLKELDGFMRKEDILIINAFTQEAIRRGVMAFVDSKLGEQIIYRIGQDLAVLVGNGLSQGLDASTGRVIDVSPQLE